jgi:hypothetical protein
MKSAPVTRDRPRRALAPPRDTAPHPRALWGVKDFEGLFFKAKLIGEVLETQA